MLVAFASNFVQYARLHVCTNTGSGKVSFFFVIKRSIGRRCLPPSGRRQDGNVHFQKYVRLPDVLYSAYICLCRQVPTVPISSQSYCGGE